LKVSKKFRYGLRAMVELAIYYKSGPLSAKSIAMVESIPLQYLEQIFNLLKNAGLVKTIRGSKGGYLLAREPSRIKVSHIMDILDTNPYLTDCLAPKQIMSCDNIDTCAVTKFWQKLQRSVKTVVDSTTLKDLAAKRPKDASIGHNYMFQI